MSSAISRAQSDLNIQQIHYKSLHPTSEELSLLSRVFPQHLRGSLQKYHHYKYICWFTGDPCKVQLMSRRARPYLIHSFQFDFIFVHWNTLIIPFLDSPPFNTVLLLQFYYCCYQLRYFRYFNLGSFWAGLQIVPAFGPLVRTGFYSRYTLFWNLQTGIWKQLEEFTNWKLQFSEFTFR